MAKVSRGFAMQAKRTMLLIVVTGLVPATHVLSRSPLNRGDDYTAVDGLRAYRGAAGAFGLSQHSSLFALLARLMPRVTAFSL